MTAAEWDAKLAELVHLLHDLLRDDARRRRQADGQRLSAGYRAWLARRNGATTGSPVLRQWQAPSPRRAEDQGSAARGDAGTEVTR